MGMDSPDLNICPDNLLAQAVEIAGADDARGVANLDQLLETYGEDGRLHFLRGSVLAGMQRYDEALPAMRRAVQAAPGFAVARFQLGLLELSSGLPQEADATLQPLDLLPPDHPLRIFGAGLRNLIRDNLSEAVRLLREGIAVNTENPAMNNDMRLLAEQTQLKIDQGGDAPPPAAAEEDEPTSLAHLALQQFAAKPTRH
jgi:tetratricopeptide (TPR) repeat protein